MKPKTFFRLALLIPYILWGICLLIASLPIQETSAIWNTILTPVMFYTIGIILWFIPYTLLAIGLVIWSRQRSMEAIYKVSIVSPFLLVILMILESIMVSIGTEGIGEILKSTLEASLLLGGLSLVFGYLCVEIALGFYKLLRSKNMIKDEAIAFDELPALAT